MIVISTFLFVVFIIFYIIIRQKYGKYFRMVHDFGGTPAYPLIGTAHHFINKKSSEMLQMFMDYSRDFSLTGRHWMGPEIHLCTADPKFYEVILSSSTEINKSDMYKFLKNWLVDGLLLSQGKKWVTRRKMITPTFHFRILEQFLDIFDHQGDILIDILGKYAEGNEAFEAFSFVSLYALDVICESAMGISIEAQKHTSSEYVKAVKEYGYFGYYKFI